MASDREGRGLANAIAHPLDFENYYSYESLEGTLKPEDYPDLEARGSPDTIPESLGSQAASDDSGEAAQPPLQVEERADCFRNHQECLGCFVLLMLLFIISSMIFQVVKLSI